MRRGLLVLLLLLWGAGTAVADDIVVVNGVYSGTLCAKLVNGKLHQCVTIADAQGNIVTTHAMGVSSRALDVTIVDSAGNPITSFGGGGGAGGTVNQGTPAAGGSAWPMTVTSTADTIVKPGDVGNNAVRVNIVAGAAAGGTSATDGAGFTAGASAGTPVMGVKDDAAPSAVTENNMGIARITGARGLHVNLRDDSGNELGSASSPFRYNLTQINGNTVEVGAGTAGTGTQRVAIATNANTISQGTAAAGAGAWPTTITNTADTVVKPGDAANNAVRVNIVAGAAAGGTSTTDQASVTAGATAGTLIQGYRDDTSPSTLTEGQAGNLRATQNRGLHVNIRNDAGTEVGTSGAPLSTTANLAQVNATTVAVNNGTASAGTQRVTIASDSTFLPPDTTGSTVALNALDVRAPVALNGQRSANVTIAAGTLTGTVVAECSPDNQTTWPANSGVFIDSTGTSQLSVGLTNPNALTVRAIVCLVPATHASVRVSVHTTGTANATARAVAQQPMVTIVGTDGVNPRVPVVMNSNPAGTEYGLVTRNVTGASGGTSINDNTGFSAGTTPITPTGFVRQDSPASVTDGRVAAPRMNAQRVVMVAPTDSGGSDTSNTTLHSWAVHTASQTQIAGQTTGSTITSFVACNSQLVINVTSATTQLVLDAGGAATRQRICGYVFQLDTEASGNTYKLVRGAAGGSNCDTSQADVTPAFTKSMIHPATMQPALDTGADNSQLCLTVTGTSALRGFIRYATW